MRLATTFPVVGVWVWLWLGLTACHNSARQTAQASWKVFPLQRHQTHDGLAVVNQPDGYGLHIFLETDRSQKGRCKPRWLVDPARLFNGNGSQPFSSGVATRQEFFAAAKRAKVLQSLEAEIKALCQSRAPDAQWQWVPPPQNNGEVKELMLPAFEEQHLLTDPSEEMSRQEALLKSP